MDTCKISKNETFQVNSEGWLKKAFQSSMDRKSFCIVLTGPIAQAVFKAIRDRASGVSKVPLIGSILKVLGVSKPTNIPDPAAIIGALAGAGAVGAALGAVQTVMLDGKAKGASVAVCLLLKAEWLNLTDDEVHIEMLWG